MSAIEASDETFDELIRTGVVLVSFEAPGISSNGHRHAVEDAAAGRRLPLVRVNVSLYPQTAEQLEIFGVPHLLLIRDGLLVAELRGSWGSQLESYRGKDEPGVVRIRKWLDDQLDRSQLRTDR